MTHRTGVLRLRRRPAASTIALVIVVILAIVRLAARPSHSIDLLLAGQPVSVKRVVDGDTLLLESGHRVRLIGVDTPETKHPDRAAEWLGEEASQFTAQLVGAGPVRLEFDRERRDRYRRLLAYVYLPDGRMLNEELIRAGFSEARTHFPYRSDRKRLFLAAEEAARIERLGLWAETRTAKGHAPQPGDLLIAD